MNERIKNSIDKIEPESGTKERMYQNILKKAAKAEQPKMSPAKVARIALPIAACVCIVIFGITKLSPETDIIDPGETTSPNVMLGSPVIDVENASDFATLGITIDAPEGAENITYAIIDGEIASVKFSLGGHSYRLRASASGDPSGMNGEILSHEQIENGGDAELVTMDVLGIGECKLVKWTSDGIYFSIYNSDGAADDELRAVFEKIK